MDEGKLQEGRSWAHLLGIVLFVAVLGWKFLNRRDRITRLPTCERKNLGRFSPLRCIPFFNLIGVERPDTIPNHAVSHERPTTLPALLGFNVTDGFAIY